jgi:hypothetical protein
MTGGQTSVPAAGGRLALVPRPGSTRDTGTHVTGA